MGIRGLAGVFFVARPFVIFPGALPRLIFESFPKAPLEDLDVLTIEFTAAPETELLIDDVHLLGRWREDF